MTAAQMLLFPEETLPSRSVVPVSPKPTCKPSLPVPPTAAEASTLPPMDSKGRAQQLRDQLTRLQGKHTVQDDAVVPVYSTGGEVLDKWLPHLGLRPGTTVQWIGERSSDCAASLALIAAGQIALSANSGGKPLVIFDLNKTCSFYPPAAIALGLPADRMVVVRRQSHHTAGDMLWAIDQALRCEAVAGVWAEIGTELNDRDARRLQLAAETGNTVGMWVRPESVRRQPSFADINWFVQAPRVLAAAPSRTLQVTLDRCRGGIEGATAMIDIPAIATETTQRIVASTRSHHESTLVSDLARRLAHPAATKRNQVCSQPAAKQRVG